MANSSERLAIGQSSNLRPPSIDLRILVVDDDATTLAVVSSMLQIWRYKVETAKNPLDALATLRLYNGLFDLVVTDLHMPFMNGFELTKQIGKEFKLPVIMMSADEEESVIHESVRCGIVQYISKPVSPDDLKNVWMFVDRAKKGKSVAVEGIGNNAGQLLRPDHKSLGGFDRTSQRYGGGFGGAIGRTGFGSYLSRSTGISFKRPGTDGKGSNTKPCNRKDRDHRPKRPKKTKMAWTNSLHHRFLLAMRHLGYSTVPKKILEFMNVPGLTRENVASHLQKYRMFLKRVAENGLLDATKMLMDRFMRSSFATGHAMDLMLEHAQQMYPHLFRKAQPAPPPAPLPPQPPRPVPTPPSLRLAQEASTSRGPAPPRPVGLSTLLMDNRPSPNIVQQPILGNPNYINNNIARSDSATAHTNNNNNDYNNQARPGFVSRAYSFNNSNSGGANRATNGGGGQILTRFNQGVGFLNNGNSTMGINNIAGNISGNGFGNYGGGRSSYNNLQVLSGSNGSIERYPNNNGSSQSLARGGNGLLEMVNSTARINVGTNNNNNFGGNFGDTTGFLNQTNQLPVPVPQNYELRVEDYASDLTDIAFEEARDRRVINNNNNYNNNQVNGLTNQSVILQNPDVFTAANQLPRGVDQLFGQVQGNEQGLLNALPFESYFPRISDQIPLQPQGLEQILQNSTSNALPSDNYFPRINPIPIQSLGISEQVLQNPAGYNNVQPLGMIEQVMQNPDVNNIVQPVGIIEQVVPNLGNNNNALPSSSYFPAPAEQSSPLQAQGNEQVLQNPSDVFQSESYYPRIDEINNDQVDWDEFMDSLLNDTAPDLRE